MMKEQAEEKIMGDKDKKEQLDIAAGGTGEGAEHRKEHPKNEAETPAEKKAREEAEAKAQTEKRKA